MWTPGPISRSYDHLEVVNRLPILHPLPQYRDNRYRFSDPLFRLLPPELKDSLRPYVGEFYRVQGTVSSVELSIKKMDHAPVRVYLESPYYDQSLDLVYSQLYAGFENFRETSLEEIATLLNFNTSPGQYWLRCGFKKKQDVYESEEAFDQMIMSPALDYIPIWKIADKTEWYPLASLDANKVRTFIIPPVELVHYCKKIYHYQNESLKGSFWSAYGFNPYGGGTHNLAVQLNKNPIKICYDVSGWDRKFPILQDVYDIRNSFVPEDHMPTALWVARNTIESFLLHPDGHVFFKRWGNNSGSGNTTPDNIIGHEIILVYTLLTLFEGDVKKVLTVFAALFGDDDVLSMPDYGYSFDHIESVFRLCFSHFGFELDPFRISTSLEDMEFLGFRFRHTEFGYVPQYDIGRLVASFCCSIDKACDVVASLSKAWTLHIMSAADPGPSFDLMSACLLHYFDSLRDSDNPQVQGYLRNGVPSRSDCLAFCLGLECSLDPSMFVDCQSLFGVAEE